MLGKFEYMHIERTCHTKPKLRMTKLTTNEELTGSTVSHREEPHGKSEAKKAAKGKARGGGAGANEQPAHGYAVCAALGALGARAHGVVPGLEAIPMPSWPMA
jgi:hypothetical protein